MKKWGKKLLGLLLCTIMIAGLLPGTLSLARAEKEKAITGLGTGAITNPASGAGGWSKVYFGSKNNPILFNVLTTNTSNFGGTTMLLDCASILQHMKFDDDYSPNTGAQKANEWAFSDIRTWLNGTFLTDRFTTIEASAIAESTKAGKGQGDGDGRSGDLGYAPLNQEQVFLLDAVEATNTTYGFENKYNSSNTRLKKLNDSSDWWLRSPYSNDGSIAGVVSINGDLFDHSVDNAHIGVSPALNINLSSVIFSSLIPGTEGSAGAEYKLTLLDSKMIIAEGSAGVSRSGNTITVPYSITGEHKNDANQVSVLIMDSAYSAGTTATSGFTYLKLDVGSFGTTGTGTFTLPKAYADKTCGTDYYAYILAEDINNGNATDYASAPASITIPAAHTHSWTYSASGATITAKCTSGCPDGYDNTNAITLTLTAPTGSTTYDGNPREVTVSGYPATAPANLAAAPTVTYYQSTGSGSTTPSGSALSGAPSDMGTYVAQMTWDGKTASLAFAITGRTMTVSASDVDVNYDGDPHGISVTVSVPASGYTVKYGTTEGTYDLDTSPTITNVSESPKTVYYQVTADNYATVAGSATVTISKANNPASVTGTATVMRGGNTVDLADNVTLNGATGAVSYEISGEANGCTLNGSILTSGANTGSVTVNVTVAADDNYNALAATPIAVTITDKGIQTITAADVTATYGDTNKSVSATVTDPATGGGAISYAVKAGSEDYIDVNASTGALTIKKVPADGKTYVIVTAAETATYAEATKEVTVTISKALKEIPAAPTAANVTENSITLAATDGYEYSIDGINWQTSPVFTGLESDKEYTFYQRIAGDENHELSPASQGTAITTGSIIYTVTENKGSEHTVGSGEDAVYTVKRNANDADETFKNYTGAAVDGKAIPAGGSTAESGSLVLTLKSSYLDTLSVGDHKVKISFADGMVEAPLKIKAAAPTPSPTPAPTPSPTPHSFPKTGDNDNPVLWIGLILLGIVGLAVLGVMKASLKRK